MTVTPRQRTARNGTFLANGDQNLRLLSKLRKAFAEGAAAAEGEGAPISHSRLARRRRACA